MGTIFTLAIEVRDRQNPYRWDHIAAIELGKAYELLGVDWRDPREELAAEARAKRGAEGAAARLGYVFSRCPHCAGDLDGKPGAYTCRECGKTCAVPGRYNGLGQVAPDDATARALVEKGNAERLEELKREPWRVGEPDRPWYDDDDDRTARGVRDVRTVLEALQATIKERDERDLEPGCYSFSFVAAIAALAAVELESKSNGLHVRCVLWGD